MGKKYEATSTSPDETDLNEVRIHDPNAKPKNTKENLSMVPYSHPKMNSTTTVTTAIVTSPTPTTTGVEAETSNTTTSAGSTPVEMDDGGDGVVKVSAL